MPNEKRKGASQSNPNSINQILLEKSCVFSRTTGRLRFNAPNYLFFSCLYWEELFRTWLLLAESLRGNLRVENGSPSNIKRETLLRRYPDLALRQCGCRRGRRRRRPESPARWLSPGRPTPSAATMSVPSRPPLPPSLVGSGDCTLKSGRRKINALSPRRKIIRKKSRSVLFSF